MREHMTGAATLDTAAFGWQLFESSTDCVKLLDADGALIAMNRNGLIAMEVADFSAIEGHSWSSLWPAESRQRIDGAVVSALAGETSRFQAACPTALGTPKWWDVAVSPVAAPAGRVTHLLVVSRDVTDSASISRERERLLAELQAANDRLADIFRQAPAFMCVLRGPDHVFEMTNDRYLQLVGNRDLLGQPVRQALPEIAGQGFFELLDGVYATGKAFVGIDMPVLLQRVPGAPQERRYLDLVYMALRDAAGRITGLLAHGVDQTERKLTELSLHESRERFAKIVNQAATGVVQMDANGLITLVNEKYCQMLGYTEPELIGMSAMDVTASESRAATRAAIDGLAAGGEGFVIDKEYRRKDGSLVPATSSVNPLRGPDGQYQGFVAIVLDTTASKQAAAALQASEQRYRTLFESMDQGFCILEMIFGSDGTALDYRFLEMNPTFALHTGLGDATGRTARELLPGLDRFWFDTYGRVAQTGEAVRFESEAPAMGRWFDVYATRIGDAGSNKVALLFTDITARKRSDDTLRQQAADLAKADRRKTEFLATLAHELRNPLAPIRSGLGVLRLAGHQPDVTAKVHAMMERQVGNMVHLIDDLLDIARISGDKLELKRSRVDLKQVLDSAVETSLPLIEAGAHAFTMAVPDDILPMEVDATRIAQVFANLLNNAAKYTPPGGSIALRARRDGADVVVEISDSGVGIPPGSLTTIFDMFSQIGRDLDRAQGGLGIGLSLVRTLVGMHGGAVTADSPGPGQGSTFTVRLPLAHGA